MDKSAFPSLARARPGRQGSGRFRAVVEKDDFRAVAGKQSAADAFNEAAFAGKGKGKEGAPTILFNSTKRETHTPNNGFKRLFRKMRSQYRVVVNRDDLVEKMKEVQPSLVVFGCPREKFSQSELNFIKGECWGS